MESVKVPEAQEWVGDWKVVEKFNASKDLKMGTEDGMFIGKNFAVVLDGVSSFKDKDINGRKYGQFTVDAAIAALNKPEAVDLKADEIVPYLTSHIAAALEKAKSEGAYAPDDKHDAPNFVFIAFFPKENCMIRVGDCMYLVDGVGNNLGIPADLRKTEMGKRIIEVHEKKGQPLSDAERTTLRNDLVEWLWKHRNQTNGTYGYGAIDGTPVPEKYVEKILIDPKEKVVISSDGWAEALAMSLMQSNENARRMLNDPLQKGKFPFDDITSVGFVRT